MPFWARAVAGWAVIVWALVGVARHAVDTRPAQLARFLAGGILVHDLVVPLALLAAVTVARGVPNRWRPYVQAALVVITGLSVFALLQVRGYGRIPSNPTALPHHYRANLAIAVATVVLLTAVLDVARPGRRRLRERRLGRYDDQGRADDVAFTHRLVSRRTARDQRKLRRRRHHRPATAAPLLCHGAIRVRHRGLG